jgi:NAD-dependent deacetylase
VAEQSLKALTDKVADLIVNAQRIVIFTGAGHSTESGIPDFRGPDGLWSRFDPNEFTYQNFIRNPETRKKQWQLRYKGGLVAQAEPNPAHYAIAELDKLDKLDCVITQNVDNLLQRAGVPEEKVLELHGNMQWAVCLSCGQHYPLAQIKARLDASDETPDCEICHGIPKPAVILFGEALPVKVLEEATRRSYNCDLFIVIGSSLVVYPAAYMPIYAVESGAKLVIINISPTPMDQQATALIRAKAGEIMPKIIKGVEMKISS